MNKKKTDPVESLGTRLQSLINDYGTSPEKLGPVANVSSVQIRSIIKGTSPHRTTVEKIAAALGTTADYLISGVGEPLPNGKRDLKPQEPEAPNVWKDEAWQVAKAQINKKDEQLEEKDNILKMLAVSFDRVTKMMQDSGMSFLQPVKGTARKLKHA